MEIVRAVGGDVLRDRDWLVGSLLFSKRRDIENDRRKLRTEYLLEAYRRLQSGTHRRGNEKAYWEVLESAVTDIQLLGTPKQAKLAAQFAVDMAENDIGYLDDLLTDLRASLREELNLEKLVGGSRVLRFYDKGKENPLVGSEADSRRPPERHT